MRAPIASAQVDRFVHDRRGLWLRVPGGAPGVHLNARPVHRMAQLRAGDLVCLASLRVLVQADAQPAIERRIPAQAPAALGEAQRVSAARVVAASAMKNIASIGSSPMA